MNHSTAISSRRPPRILLAGGGTGGHVYPAIAIADAIMRRNPRAVISFAGSRQRIEWKAVPAAGYPIQEIPARGLERSFSPKAVLGNLGVPLVLAKGLRAAMEMVRGFDPDVVVGTGGFVALPVLLAARLLKRRVVIQEQNAYMGLTNRIAARFADQIHVAFPEAVNEALGAKVKLSGNPVRPELAAGDRADARAELGMSDRASVLLVLGGSGGSRPLNRAVERLLPELFRRAPDSGVVWQTGSRFHSEVESRVETADHVALLPYIDHMEDAYAAADLALCRAGALTCSELMLTGTPAVLVPSPFVAEDHQTKNARSLAETGGAVLVPQSEMDDRLAAEIIALLEDAGRRERMARALRDRARPTAADTIARDVLRLVEVTA